MSATREQVFTALFNLVSTSASFATASRRLKLWTDLGSGDKPAIFVAERGDNYVRHGGDAMPAIVTYEADIFIYTDAGKDQGIVPATALNNLLDAVDAALAPNWTGRQTLGGLVSHCWIEGKIMKDPGDLDGDGLAIIPVKILATI